jgi:hypothetical protein
MLNLKNEVVSHQVFMRRAKFEKIENIKKMLIELKADYNANEAQILELELKFNNLKDQEMRAELLKFKHYDILNNEKMSPRFLALAKIRSKEVSLSVIKDDAGTAFDRDSDRNEYIKQFYAGIYKDDKSRTLAPGAVRDFLGEEL